MRYILAVATLVLAGCGGSNDGGITNPPPPKKPDPWITVRVRDQLDTTTAPGRANWRIYEMLTGQDANRNGFAFQRSISMAERRQDRSVYCVWAGADSVGQRIYEAVAFADTTTETILPDATFDQAATRWFSGDHVLPQGWMALTTGTSDAWNSQQYLAGHGLIPSDPIKLGFDWAGNGTTSFYERADSDSHPDCDSIQGF